jgi:hypothetical protein
MESASELLGVGSREHEIYKRRCEGKGGFWLAFDVTVRTAARNHKPRNGVAWEVWETERPSPSRPGPVVRLHMPQSKWKCECIALERASRATAIKKQSGEHTAKIDKGCRGFYYVKIQKCVGAFSEKAHGLDTCPINVPPSLASLTRRQLAQSPKSRCPAHGHPSKDWHLMYPEPAALPSTKPANDIHLCHDSCKCQLKSSRLCSTDMCHCCIGLRHISHLVVPRDSRKTSQAVPWPLILVVLVAF